MNDKIVNIKVFEPENFKKSLLIANKYRKSDVAIMIGSAIAVGLGIFLFIFRIINLLVLIVLFFLIPALLALLVQPLNNYHNHLEWLRLCRHYQSDIRHYSCFVNENTQNGE